MLNVELNTVNFSDYKFNKSHIGINFIEKCHKVLFYLNGIAFELISMK